MGAPDGRENDLAGNTADARTVEAIVTMMEKKYGRGKRIRVMDRGMVSEGNLEFFAAARGPRHMRKPTPPCANAPPRTPERSSGESGAGWAAAPERRSSSMRDVRVRLAAEGRARGPDIGEGGPAGLGTARPRCLVLLG